MGKFSDPNYKLLKDYFDILVAVRTGTDKSYLIGPNKTVVSEGGLYSILYENHDTRGYVGHRFKIKEITGNRFKMTYEGLESTFSVASSAFDIGNEMYFRKDSFFHYWLARPTQDNSYHDYANQEKTFMFFGKIWPVSNEVNTYSIEFEGLKDFTLKGLPQHNQTVNMTEWLKVYWDQIHHEMYNMTKHFWAMLDAREIDLRWLGYIAQTYGIEITETVLNELSLREWVENLPYFLKRVGTYNALYIIWKVFLSNTSNHLNVYERWGEWCAQNLDNAVDTFEDHHFLEFYGTQPSGGAGTHYYSQFNPANYPTHSLVAPTGDCGTYYYPTNIKENYLTFSLLDLNCQVGDIRQDSIQLTKYDPQTYITQVIVLSGGSYSGNFTHATGVMMDSSTSASNVTFWGMSRELAMLSDHSGDYLSLSFEISGGSRFFKLLEWNAGVPNAVKSTGTYSANTPYYVTVDRQGSTLRTRIFDQERRWSDDLIETISITLNDIDTHTYLYALNGRRISSGKFTGRIYGLSTENVTLTETVATSGYPVITPHYKVQVDLSTEPLGDVFNDGTIISEDVITELVRNFEYVRPVSKYVHYEEMISPVGQVDRVGDSVALYPLDANGFMNTFFTGASSISAGGGGLGIDTTMSYYQQFASKTWTIQHNLDSEYVLVQPWVFVGPTSTNAKLVKPDVVQIVNNNTVQLIFNESVRGVASVASSGASGVGFVELDYLNNAQSTWTIDHNLGTNTPSGYSTSPGPVVTHWDQDKKRMIALDTVLASNDNMGITWAYAVSGASVVRRSDYIHTQSSPASVWNIAHKLNSWVIVQCYDITTNREIIPDDIRIVDKDRIKVIWNSNTRGYAHIVQVVRDNVIYSPYSCDIFGFGMCADVLGYWKVGTGEDTLWNPFNENDLETPMTSGTYSLIEQDVNNVYIDLTVPSEYQDINITEIGLFNYLDQLVLYSRCSDLFKPEGVQCFFHYRIGKLSSSSSSSSSESSSSSSESSS